MGGFIFALLVTAAVFKVADWAFTEAQRNNGSYRTQKPLWLHLLPLGAFIAMFFSFADGYQRIKCMGEDRWLICQLDPEHHFNSTKSGTLRRAGGPFRS